MRYLIIFIIFLAGCTNRSLFNDDIGSCGSKELFSKWNAKIKPQIELDFSNLQIGDNRININSCNAYIGFNGTNCGGIYTIINVSETHECQGIDQEGFYSKTDNGLEICSGKNCSLYN